MPRYRVIEYHSYSLTFEVTADNEEAAKALASDMATDEADEEELGTDDVTVEQID